MARSFSLFKKGTTEAIQTVTLKNGETEATLTINGLASGTAVNAGDYQVQATDDGATPSNLIDVPAFTVLAATTTAAPETGNEGS